MAKQRRGGGFRPPEIRGTLGTLLRTTLEQAGAVRDALGRGAREGRARLDDALATRRRKDALAELGEVVLDLIRRGEIDLDELPEARELVRALDELDEEEVIGGPAWGRSRGGSARDRGEGSDDDSDFRDDAAAARRGAGPAAEPGAWRARADAPSMAARDRIAGQGAPRGPGGRRGGADRDGTVSSRERWAPARPAAGPARVWRPNLADARDAPSPARSAPPARGGGIRFDPDPDAEHDEDLTSYMHPEDVPPRGRSDGGGGGDGERSS